MKIYLIGNPDVEISENTLRLLAKTYQFDAEIVLGALRDEKQADMGIVKFYAQESHLTPKSPDWKSSELAQLVREDTRIDIENSFDRSEAMNFTM